jgi:hypothetical protein
LDFSSIGTCFHQPLVGRVLIYPRQPFGSARNGGVGDSDFSEGDEEGNLENQCSIDKYRFNNKLYDP